MVTACQTCGIVVEVAEESEHKYICPECSSVVIRSKNEVKITLMLGMTALILMIPSAIFPFINIMINEVTVEASLIDTAGIMFKDGYDIAGAVIFITALVFPLLYLLSIIYLSVACLTGLRLPFSWRVLRTLGLFEHFQMTDVFLVGILVSVVKLVDMADVSLGKGFYFLIVASVLIVAIDQYYDRHLFWCRKDHEK